MEDNWTTLLAKVAFKANADAERVTLPVNPSMLLSVIVVVPEVPGDRLSELGLTEILKSGPVTSTSTKVVRVRFPLDATIWK